VLISDSDTVWLRDPRGFLDEGPFMVADVLVSTDCIDTTADEICNTEYCGWGPPPSTQPTPLGVTRWLGCGHGEAAELCG
jgi:hypothetical protein